MAGSDTTVAGIDRWRGGWVIATVERATLTLTHADTIDETLEHTAECASVAVDMPIALATHGRRDAEVRLKQFLGRAGRSVFYSPTRAALDGVDRADADAINRAHGGPGMSAQGWALAGSIRELRSALTNTSQAVRRRWWETHPESAFAVMNAGQALTSKRSAVGVAQRTQILRAWTPQLEASLLDGPEKVPIDDALDAVAAAWSASRIVRSCAQTFGEPARDDEDFSQGIWI